MTELERGTGQHAEEWLYGAVKRFGESTLRAEVMSGVEDELTWDGVSGRLTSWTRTPGFARAYGYDGAGRLTSVVEDGTDVTSLHYDVDDVLVYEDRRKEAYHRLAGSRLGPEGVPSHQPNPVSRLGSRSPPPAAAARSR